MGRLFCLLRTMKIRVKIPMEIVELEEGTIHLLAPVVRDGLENHWWVVDSGASRSVIDTGLVSYFVEEQSEGSMATGLGKEMVETTVGTIKNFCLGGKSFDDLQVAIVDLHHINEEYSKYSDKKIAGLLGSDFFFRERAIIDYANETLLL